MKRTLVISDIHGCIEPFNRLLTQVGYASESDRLVLIGDYVDRGPDSRAVVERVIDLVDHHGAIALRGNHDQRLVDLVRDGSGAVKAKFLEHGGLQTLQSYCGAVGELTDEGWERAIDAIRTDCRRHISFLEKLPLYHEDDAHIYVHAGLNPVFPNWKEQPERDFMYIKDEFIRARFELTRKIVFGHTRTADIHGRPAIWFGGDKIGIDGGCAYGMQLNVLIFENGAYTTDFVRGG